MATTQQTETHATYESSDKHLRKSLSFLGLFFLSMGGIIGSGWLFAVLGADALAGPAVVISWVIGGILILFVALNYAEVAGMIPRTGAIVRYPHMTHGSYTGYVLAWAYFITAITVPTIEAEAVITYASSYIHGLTVVATVSGSKVTVLTWPGIGLAVALTIVFFILNYFGIKLMGMINTVVTWWKFIIPTITFILLFFLFRGSNFVGYGGFTPLGIAPIFLAIPTGGIVFAYLGFRQALDFGGEARNPQRDVPLATILSVITATILYVLLQLAFTGSLNWGAAGVKPGDWAGLTSSSWATAPFALDLKASGMSLLVAFAVLLYVDAFVSPAGTGLVYNGTATRTIYGIAVDGYFPPIFSKVNRRWGIPVASLIAAMILSWVFLLPLPSWYLLVGFISSGTVLTYIMGGVALQVLRRTAPELHRPFHLRGAAVLSPIGFLAAALIVYWSGTTVLNYVVTAVLIGLPIYAWFYAPRNMGLNQVGGIIAGILMLAAIVISAYFGPLGRNAITIWQYDILLAIETGLFTLYMWLGADREKRHQILTSIWFFVFMLGLYIFAYLGPFGPLKKPIIPFAWDELVVIVFSLIMFYFAVASGYKTPAIAEIIASQGEGGTSEIPNSAESSAS